ncbi:C39 family peptidase [Kamptonema cortianum]|nr:C39 family peptidase [Oscillatoria laete-virens]MDK3157896.1 C39 family peptidase [Kamptonema cortianum]MDL5046026.1 C39 family peptidase [Oscillatoria amoena NRMC-F 0135]MDL5052734.1 C39 family peptidase [Oscillatoria laete-virens NRMC-F 0139]
MPPHKMIYHACGLIVFLWLAAAVATAQHNFFLSDEVAATNAVTNTPEVLTNSIPEQVTNHAPAQIAPGSENAAGVTEADPALEKLRALNAIIWEEGDLWRQDAAALAAKLGLVPEGTPGKTVSTFRSYGGQAVDFDGVTPATTSLVGDPERVTELGFVFINQGDFFGDLTGSPDRQNILSSKEREFRKQMDDEENRLKAFISTALGAEPRTALVGTGHLREKVHRWDMGETSLLLAVLPERYVALRIWPKSLADSNGRPVRITATELKERLKDNVVKRDNGDVTIENIPMINQGPKGYCVPATYERLLRYVGLSADMYALANSGGTRAGGGTVVEDMNRAVDGLLSRAGRRVQGSLPMTFSEISRWIDRGVPLIWTMFVTPDIENQSNEFTRQRQSESFDEWKKAMRRYQTPVGFQANRSGAHVRMIVGYNKDTQEIAYSDSWGPEFQERWMPFEAAKAVTPTTGGLQAITW